MDGISGLQAAHMVGALNRIADALEVIAKVQPDTVQVNVPADIVFDLEDLIADWEAEEEAEGD